MRDSASPELYRPPLPNGRPSSWVDAMQAIAVLAAIVIAWFYVTVPASEEAQRVVDVRLEAIHAFEDLARRVESVRDIDVARRGDQIDELERMMRELEGLWSAAGVSATLRPELEHRPIGPVLTLVDVGPDSEPPR